MKKAKLPLKAYLHTRIGALLPVVALLWLSGRMALGGRFPLPFDESYHWGLIRFYGRHLNPFLASQPAGMDGFGAMAREPSYLYHYLLSFPYRLIAFFVHDETTQIVMLRFLNIGLALVSLYLVYRLARRVGLPQWGGQLVSLAVALTPAFYSLSAQLNYDNLMIPLTLLSLLWSIDVAKSFEARRVEPLKLASVLALVLLTSLVKYAYLPIALTIGAYLLVKAVRCFGVRGLAAATIRDVKRASLASIVVAAGLLILSGGLWAQRYGVNLARYHTPHPQCHAVLSVSACQAYAPWARNYRLHETRTARPLAGSQFVPFAQYWARSMYMESYARITEQGDKVVYTFNYQLQSVAKLLIIVGAVGALVGCRVFLRQRRTWALLGLVGLTYSFTLWAQNYADFLNLHAFVAIQARYFLPVLPVLYIATAAGFYAFAVTVTQFQMNRLTALLVKLLVIGWLGLRRLRHVGQVAVHGLSYSPRLVSVKET